MALCGVALAYLIIFVVAESPPRGHFNPSPLKSRTAPSYFLHVQRAGETPFPEFANELREPSIHGSIISKY